MDNVSRSNYTVSFQYHRPDAIDFWEEGYTSLEDATAAAEERIEEGEATEATLLTDDVFYRWDASGVTEIEFV